MNPSTPNAAEPPPQPEPAPPPHTPDPPARAPSLTHRTARGFAWLMVQSLCERVISAAGQVALAWFLDPGAYKLLALVYTVTAFAGLLQQAGLGQVLVQRHVKFERWATPVFWMSLSLGLAAGLATAAASGLMADFYGQPALRGLLLVAALSLPLNSLVIVPDASLRIAMRFKLLAMTGLGATATAMTLSVIFAALGLGAYSFVLPQPIVLVLRAVVLWLAARPSIRRRLEWRRWRLLIGDSGFLLLANLALMCTYVGDWAILGRMYRDTPAVGIYYFALTLADQANRALVFNLTGVLFPALSSLQDDPKRQTSAFLRAARTLSLVGIPICLLQCALAGPLFRVAFPDDKAASIPIFAVISLAMIGRQVFGPSESMLMAQRRQRTYATLALVYAPIFLALAAAGASKYGPIGVAWVVTVCSSILGPVALRIAIAPAGGSWLDVARVFKVPAIAAALGIGPAAAVRLLLPPTLAGDLAAIALVPTLSLIAYALIVRRLQPDEFAQAAAKLGALKRRFAA